MTTLNFYSNEKNVGNQIINTNPFFNDLNKLMNNTDFKQMYETHFKSWSDIETLILYMKLYSFIKEEYENHFNEEIDNDLMTYTLNYIIRTKDLRECAINSLQNFKNGKNNYIDNFRTMLKLTEISKTREITGVKEISNS